MVSWLVQQAESRLRRTTSTPWVPGLLGPDPNCSDRNTRFLKQLSAAGTLQNSVIRMSENGDRLEGDGNKDNDENQKTSP